METIRLPFHIGRLYGGAAKIEGFVFLGPEDLSLEYRLRDAFFGAFTGAIQSQAVAWEDLDWARCGPGFFRPWLLLAARSLSTFDKLPNADTGQIRLRVPWGHRRQLRTLTSEINLQLSFREADRYRRRLPGVEL